MTAAAKLDEVLALPARDRAYLAHALIASLDKEIDPDAEMKWRDEIDRRTKEMDAGISDSRSESEMINAVRARIHARRQAS
jgi:putative addiction module component (TIGR02574 family)